MKIDQVMAALGEVIDPELGMNIVDLGLVHRITVDGPRIAVDLMTTNPACPLAEQLSREAEAAVRRGAADAADVAVRVVHDPAWTPERMSTAAKAHFGWVA
jgi:metal-sulfur cluster biosynthetic enzyme